MMLKYFQKHFLTWRDKMANMGYVKFQNTLKDLEDCKDSLDMNDDLSASEEKARDELINTSIDIAIEYGNLVDREVEETE